MKIHSSHELLKLIKKDGYKRIGLDGKDGVGKSTLAQTIVKDTGFSIVELDSFLEKDRGGFIEFLRYDELKDALDVKSFVVEGVCLLEALGRIGCELDLLVYVRRLRYGVWRDADVCDIEGDPEEVIEHEREELRKFAKFEAFWKKLDEEKDVPELPGLDMELIRYHATHRPHKHAQVIYEIETANNHLQCDAPPPRA